MRYVQSILTADQVMAEKKQDYITLKKALAEIPIEAVVQAVRVLEADAVDRSEKTLGVAKWLLDLHQRLEVCPRKGKYLGNPTGSRAHDNLVWLAVATAPPGFCHVRSSMIGTLLDDIVAGMPFEVIKRRWDEKMHPLQYQRPTTIKEGNLEQANKIVAKLGSEGSLARRFAKLEDILTFEWRPNIGNCPTCGKLQVVTSTIHDSQEIDSCVCGVRAVLKGGAFDHLRSKTNIIKPVDLPPQVIAWDKFRGVVLTAKQIEVQVPRHGAFYGMVTAVNADAPPILQWDGLMVQEMPYIQRLSRNPVSWYFYHDGSDSTDWGLPPGWTNVDAVCLKPCHWQQPDKFAHQGNGVFFVLGGAKDLKHVRGGGFFPESLRTEYHGIRAAMEAFARNAAIAGKDAGTANGIALVENQSLTVRANVLDIYQVKL